MIRSASKVREDVIEAVTYFTEHGLSVFYELLENIKESLHIDAAMALQLPAYGSDL